MSSKFTAQRSVQVLILTLLTLMVGCAGEWSDTSFAPADYQSSYTKITGKCAKSGAHGDKYVLSYMSKDAVDAWHKGDQLPVGAVVLKVGYNDSACSEVTQHWAMKKLKISTPRAIGDWSWQMQDEYGEVTNEGKISGCVSCHGSAAYEAHDFVATPTSATQT